jgi:hypothetical protein
MANNLTEIHPDFDIRTLHSAAGLTREDAAKICEVHPRTYDRWCQRGTFPALVKKYFFILAGHLPFPGWYGWKIGRDGRLYSPNLVDGFTPSEIERLPLMQSFMREYADPKRPRQYILL